MSLFRRLSDRGGFAARAAATPVMVPKGRGIRRDASERDDEDLRPLRGPLPAPEGPSPHRHRHAAGTQFVAARRQPVDDREAEDAREPRDGTADVDEGLQTSRVDGVTEADDENETVAARRAWIARRRSENRDGLDGGEGEPDSDRDARRSDVESDEPDPTARSVRRARPVDVDDPESPVEPPLDPPIDEPEPSDLRARRTGTPLSSAVPSASEAPATAPPASHFADPPIGGVDQGPPSPPHPSSLLVHDRFERPNVVIDHVDVVIHEAAPANAQPARTRSSLRARYMRRL